MSERIEELLALLIYATTKLIPDQSGGRWELTQTGREAVLV